MIRADREEYGKFCSMWTPRSPKNRLITLIGFGLMLCTGGSSTAQQAGENTGYRTFTNKAGKTIRAKVTDKKNDIVHLRMSNGITYRVATGTLSQSDQEFIDSWNPAEEHRARLQAVDLKELFSARGFKGVPLKLQNNQSLLEITIAGQRLSFLLDTGAQSSVIDRTKAKDLKLDIQENVGFAGGIGGPAGPIGMAFLPLITVGSVPKKNVTVAVLDLSGIVSGQGKSTKFDGIIGFDLLEDLEAVIDYKGRVMYLREDG
ncbi:MAG: clan AA aspartic protease [Verrucomicrobiaceae bacterium]|nr:clan AA aspartic protease [Verrucomicrobiaceae bacterium]